MRIAEPLADLLITARGLVKACLASRAMLSARMIPAFDDAIQACPSAQQLCQTNQNFEIGAGLCSFPVLTKWNTPHYQHLSDVAKHDSQAMSAMLVQIIERLTASQLIDWGLDNSCSTSRRSTEVIYQDYSLGSVCSLSWDIILQLPGCL